MTPTTTFLLLIGAMLFGMFAQSRVRSTFSQFLQVPTNGGYTGFQVARTMLDQNELSNVPIERVPGELSDHYDPRSNVLRLSDHVYHGTSIASVSVAAHEVGHAVQDAEGYGALRFRNLLAPIVAFGSNIVMILILLGLFLRITGLFDLGLIIFGLILLFQLITLPVEFDASKRALAALEQGFIRPEEEPGARKVLNAAAMTYIAATLVSAANLLRFLSLRNRR
ncbi:MAG: zinc metallopeptidase [Bacillota bacterium]|nr:zinc metallopeptidase [Bacillota bacterium]